MPTAGELKQKHLGHLGHRFFTHGAVLIYKHAVSSHGVVLMLFQRITGCLPAVCITRSYTVNDPAVAGSSLQVLPNHNGFYVVAVRSSEYIHQIAKAHNIDVPKLKSYVIGSCSFVCSKSNLSHEPQQVGNKSGGCAVNWRKHGWDYGWRLSMLLGGWVQPTQPRPDPEDQAAVRAMVSKLWLDSPMPGS